MVRATLELLREMLARPLPGVSSLSALLPSLTSIMPRMPSSTALMPSAKSAMTVSRIKVSPLCEDMTRSKTCIMYSGMVKNSSPMPKLNRTISRSAGTHWPKMSRMISLRG